MTEQAIRKKTDLLYKAYGELSGTDCILTVGEFLAMRKTAVEELRLFREREVVSEAPAPRREEKKEETKNKAPVTEKEHKGSERLINVTQMRHTKPEPKKEEAAPLSDFEILQRAKDPWN